MSRTQPEKRLGALHACGLTLLLALANPLAVMAGRPFSTEDGYVSEKGEATLEASFETWKNEEGRWDQVWVAAPAVGLGGGVEVFTEIPFVALKGRGGSPERGFGDVVLGAKARLIREETSMPGVALRLAWKTHTADARKRLGSGDNDLTAVLSASKGLGRSTLHLSAGFTREGDHLDGAVRDYAFYGGALETSLSERVRLCLEVQGSQNPERYLRENPTFALVGLTVQLSDHLLLDAGYRCALRGPGPRGAALCGVTWCF